MVNQTTHLLQLHQFFKLKTVVVRELPKEEEVISFSEMLSSKYRNKWLRKEAMQLAKDNDCPFVDNETPYGRAKKGYPVIVDYFYHEEIRGSNNTGKRNKK